MKENFAYLKDVLGMKYVSRDRSRTPAAEKALFKKEVAQKTPAKRVVFVGIGLDGENNPERALLLKMIVAMGLKPFDVAITDKLDGPKPELLIALGETSLGSEADRGKIIDFEGGKLLITHHPAYLLKNPAAKKVVWDDLKLAMQLLNLSRE